MSRSEPGGVSGSMSPACMPWGPFWASCAVDPEKGDVLGTPAPALLGFRMLSVPQGWQLNLISKTPGGCLVSSRYLHRSLAGGCSCMTEDNMAAVRIIA